MKTPLLLVLFLLPAHASFSQIENPLLQAFSDSYTQEALGLYTEAIDALQAVYADDSYELNLRLGWLYYLQGDYPRAQSYYRRAKSLLPYAVEPKLGYLLPTVALGNWTEVEKTAEEILRIDPNNPMAHFRIGQAAYNRQDYENAYKHVEKVVNLYPFDYDSVVLFAWINYQSGNRSRAYTLFQKALLIYPGSESAAEGLKLSGGGNKDICAKFGAALNYALKWFSPIKIVSAAAR